MNRSTYILSMCIAALLSVMPRAYAIQDIDPEPIAHGSVAGFSTNRGDKSGEPKEKVSLAELATLTLGGGQNIRFLLDPDAQDIALQESGSINRDTELPLLMDARLQELDPLEIYLALTPRDRAVPRAIYELSSSSEAKTSAAARALVESLEPMPAQVISYRVKVKQESEFMPELCGANGAQAFQQICNTAGASESFCEPGKHTWHGRASSAKYKQSLGFTVACQASVQTRHWRKFGLWYVKTFNHDADQYWHYTRVWNTGVGNIGKAYRTVRMDRYNPSSPSSNVSYIRSWIGFRN